MNEPITELDKERAVERVSLIIGIEVNRGKRNVYLFIGDNHRCSHPVLFLE